MTLIHNMTEIDADRHGVMGPACGRTLGHPARAEGMTRDWGQVTCSSCLALAPEEAVAERIVADLVDDLKDTGRLTPTLRAIVELAQEITGDLPPEPETLTGDLLVCPQCSNDHYLVEHFEEKVAYLHLPDGRTMNITRHIVEPAIESLGHIECTDCGWVGSDRAELESAGYFEVTA